MENKVATLLLKYKTDKHYGSVEPKLGHYYGISYDEIFENFNRFDKLNILEIGIQKGGSLLAWKDYFVNANITGVDILDSILPEYRHDKIKYIISDIKDKKVKEILGDQKFDIIIDDGSHFLPDVLFVVSNYLMSLNNKGVLIVEDCQQPEYWVNEISNLLSDEFILTTKDMRNINGHYDDFLIVIQKKNNIYLEPTYIRDNVDYSFGDQSGCGILGGYMKNASVDNLEFLDKVKSLEGVKSYMTLFIDNIRLYKRDGIKNTGMEEYNEYARVIKHNVLNELWGNNDLLKTCAALPQMKFVIFTGFEDNCIDEFILDKIPENVIGIYASNAITFGDKVHPIPYGVQRKINQEDNRHEVLINKLNEGDIEPKTLLYINHSEGTNPKERDGVKDLFMNKSWATVSTVENSHQGYDGYLNTIKTHKFMICPSGNAIGCECSRDWEVIYMKRVPVVKRSEYLEYIFKDIPVLFVNNFSDVTEELLIENNHLFESMQNFDVSKLDFKNIYDNIIKTIENDNN